MALLPVFQFVVTRSARNMARAQLKRVRQPKYLVATVLGLAYWGFYFGRVLTGSGVRRALPEGWRLTAELAVACLAVVLVSLTWVFGSDRSAMTFTEAEIQFLFPAPLSRHQLLHYKLLRALALGLVGALVTTLVLGRSTGGPPLLFALGTWVAFATFSFHNLAASFTRAGLARHGVAGLKRGLLTGGLALGALGLLAWGVLRVPRPAGVPPRDLLAALAAGVDGSALGWILWPVRAPVRLLLAPGLGDFALALPGALLVLGLHYLWVLRAVVQFEDGALEEAQRRSQLVQRVRAGGAQSMIRAKGKRRVPFRLAPRGRPEVALLWKGLIAGGRTVGLRLFVVAAAVISLSAGLVLARNGAKGPLAVAAALALCFWALTVLLGPGLVRTDLRLDLPNLEALRALPLTGAQLLRGELLAPLATLTAAQWLALPVAACLPLPGGLPVQLALAAAGALLGPVLSLAILTLQNGFVVLLPGWAAVGPGRPSGPEMLGLRMIGLLANLLALTVALLPAALLGGLVLLAGWPWLGLTGAPLAALAASAVIVAEAWAGTALLGRALERLDPSAL